METAGEGSDPSGGLMPQPLQKLKQRVARRRLSQARHRATLAGLFSSLRDVVYSHSDLSASKWQVLNKAKNHIQELEQTLDNLLKLKESFNLEDGNANSLEEAKKEYASMYSRNPRVTQAPHHLTLHSCFKRGLDSGDNDRALVTSGGPRVLPAWCTLRLASEEAPDLVSNTVHQKGLDTWCFIEAAGKDVEEEEKEEEEDQQEEEEDEEVEEEEAKRAELLHSSVTLLPDLLEFERYLNFYKQTMDFLIRNRIISSEEVTLPIVSAAISHLWQILSEEQKTILLKTWEQTQSSLVGSCPEPACPEGSVKDSGVDSQGASCSLLSTPEEILFEDAFDVARFLDKSEAPGTSSPSSALAGCNPKSPEEKFQLYVQIIDCFKGLCYVNPQPNQERTIWQDWSPCKAEALRLDSPWELIGMQIPDVPTPKSPIQCCEMEPQESALNKEPDLPVDDEMMMLRCLETFDDEDL